MSRIPRRQKPRGRRTPQRWREQFMSFTAMGVQGPNGTLSSLSHILKWYYPGGAEIAKEPKLTLREKRRRNGGKRYTRASDGGIPMPLSLIMVEPGPLMRSLLDTCR